MQAVAYTAPRFVGAAQPDEKGDILPALFRRFLLFILNIHFLTLQQHYAVGLGCRCYRRCHG